MHIVLSIRKNFTFSHGLNSSIKTLYLDTEEQNSFPPLRAKSTSTSYSKVFVAVLNTLVITLELLYKRKRTLLASRR
jgi:hypothetical protein